jgi:cullin 3
LEKAVVLLRYFKQKDMFERYYKKHLSKRLLTGRSINNDVERQMVAKMKFELGNFFTRKLEGMFNDMIISEELTTSFKAHMSRREDTDGRGPDLHIHALTTTYWPMETVTGSSGGGGGGGGGDDKDFSAATADACNFPPVLQKVKKNFEKFYHAKHSGRRLTWYANAGSADIRIVFPPVSGKEPAQARERRHEFNVSTYSLIIILLFEDVPAGGALTFEEIEAKTLIPRGDLVRNLQSLAVAPKARILLKEPMSREIKTTDRFRFNDGFTSKLMRIKVGVVAAGNTVEDDRERQATKRKNDEMRGSVIEACIVRIMKYVPLPLPSFKPPPLPLNLPLSLFFFSSPSLSHFSLLSSPSVSLCLFLFISAFLSPLDLWVVGWSKGP